MIKLAQKEIRVTGPKKNRELKCSCCKKPLDEKSVHVLSIIPVRFGGKTSDPNNIRISCGQCKNEWYSIVKKNHNEFNSFKDVAEAHSSFLESIEKKNKEQKIIRLFLLTRGKF